MAATEKEPGRPDPSARSPAAPDPAPRYCPDPACLQLEHAVENLLATRHEVRRTQGRTRALLRAVTLVTDQNEPAEALRQLVTCARDLTGAAWPAAPTPQDAPDHRRRPHGCVHRGAHPPTETSPRPAMAVPLADRDAPVGALSVARAPSRRLFGGTGVELLASFAVQAALARRMTGTPCGRRAVEPPQGP
ncbi:GAF domain-containing protein [Streptomyces malaysiense]|uniref:GAF domain-containing protein n=1 Tax=Streptomyces malaysiense TaxID=1428626 RepID=UPI000A4D1220|nr:GAF domain-containing protein [Streptomyces malaysiense]